MIKSLKWRYLIIQHSIVWTYLVSRYPYLASVKLEVQGKHVLFRCLNIWDLVRELITSQHNYSEYLPMQN